MNLPEISWNYMNFPWNSMNLSELTRTYLIWDDQGDLGDKAKTEASFLRISPMHWDPIGSNNLYKSDGGNAILNNYI